MKNFWPILVLAVFSSSIVSAGLASFMVLQFVGDDEPRVGITGAVQKTGADLGSEEVSAAQKEESIITSNSAQLEPKCLESCDDGNPCTSDVCDEATGFKCKHAILRGEADGCKGIVEGTCSRNSCVSGFCTLVYTASCCGNDKCDNGESSSTCPKDCQQTQPTAVQISSNQTQPALQSINHVVINEIQVNDNEFVELYNPTSSDVNMAGWYFSYYSDARDWNDPWRNKQFPEGSVIKKSSYFLIGLKGLSNSDWQPYTTAQLGNTKGSVAIFPFDPKSKSAEEAKNGRIDAVGYGDVQFVYEGSPAQVPAAGESLERKSLTTDTENNSDDFVIDGNPSPERASN